MCVCLCSLCLYRKNTSYKTENLKKVVTVEEYLLDFIRRRGLEYDVWDYMRMGLVFGSRVEYCLTFFDTNTIQ